MRSALTAQRRTLAYMAVEASAGFGVVGVTHLYVHRFGLAAGNMAYASVWMTMFCVLLVLHYRTWRIEAAPVEAVA